MFHRTTIRGTAQQLERQLNKLARSCALHEIWNMGVTSDPEDIELNLELNRNPQPTDGNMVYVVVSGYSAKIDALENELRQQKKYIATAHRAPLHGDKERAVAIIQKAK